MKVKIVKMSYYLFNYLKIKKNKDSKVQCCADGAVDLKREDGYFTYVLIAIR